MRILLTGASGQVGGALRTLLSGSHDLLAPARDQFDLSQPGTLGDALGHFKPDLILNPAAYTAVDRAEDEPELAYRVNQDAPAAIANWAAEHEVPLLHISTDYVFDGSGQRPWREDDPCRPLSVYGQSKLGGETGIREAGGSHLIMRTSWVFAATGSNFMRTMIRLARERPELRVVADQVGAPTSARSIAAAVGQLIEGDLPAIKATFAKAELVHMTNSGSTSWHGFASAIVDGLRDREQTVTAGAVLPIATKDFPTKAIRPANSRLDLTRLAKTFGVTTASWQTALGIELDCFVKEEAATL